MMLKPCASPQPLFLLNFLSEMTEKDFKALASRFPGMNEAEVSDLRLQFQTFDLNQDGTIDYEEL